MSEEPKKVFISYSHETPEHEAHICELVDFLRLNYIDATSDLHEPPSC